MILSRTSAAPNDTTPRRHSFMNYRIWQQKPADPAAVQALQGAGDGALFSRVLAARGVTTPQAAAPRPDAAPARALQRAGYGALFGRVLAARGVTTPQAAAQLLDARAPLSDPLCIRDMDKAAARIRRAVEEEESIVIFGDYDVDGVCATAILYECLANQGARVRCKLPSREGGGYGLNTDIIRSLAGKGYQLIITVDNGITAVEEAACARELGVDLVITDHHLPGPRLPDAVAVVDPNRADDESPCKTL